MKKIIAMLLLLTLTLGALFSCNFGTPGDDTTGATLDDAVEYLNSTYKGDEGKKTPADYKLIAQIPIDGVKFEVTWTVDNDAITITLTDGLYTVKVPAKNDTEVEYTLTATVTDPDGNSVEKKFTRILPVYDNSAAVGADDIQEGTPYKLYMVQAGVGKTLFATTQTQSDNKYIVTDVDPKAGADFYAEAVEGGYKFYTEIDGVKNYVHAKTVTADDGKVSKYIGYATESDAVYYFKADCNAWFVKIDNIEYVVGTYGSYETIFISEGTYMTPETTGVTQYPVLVMDKAAAEALDPTVPDIPADEEKTITEFNEIASAQPDKGAATLGKYLVTGKITEIANSQYGNMYIEDEAGNKLYIYGMYDKTGDNRFDAMNPQPKVGDTVVVLGVACNYNGPQMKNAWLQKLNGEDYVSSGSTGGDNTTTPSQPTGEAVIPEVGTSYKLFFVQKNAGNKTYYLTGALSGYYTATTEKASEGADFVIEATDGGYYLACTVGGAKKYVNVVKVEGTDGKTHINVKFDDAANSVWTIDETLKTVVTALEGTNYVLGTKADGTYTTLGPMKSDSGCMYAQFVIPGEDNGSTDTPDTPTDTGAVIPEVGTAYKLFFIQKNKNNTVYYMTGVLDGYYMGSTETAAEGADFSIEATDGGYYLYCMVDGAKKYVNVVKSGNYTNAKYEDAAATVWTIDETLKTVVATIEDGSYILGTKADGTYTTLGPMKSDSGCMYAQFVVGAANGGSSSGSGSGSTTKPEDNTTAGASEIKVETPYYIAGKNAAGALYLGNTVTSGRIDGTANKASATQVKLEAGAAAGEYYIYFMNGDTKTYIAAVEDKSAGFGLVTTKDDTCVWLIDAEAKTIISKSLGDRGFATQVGSSYNNFSTYATSNFSSSDYQVSWFVEVDA